MNADQTADERARMRKTLYLWLGHACMGAALVGIFLPLLPTTPFVLLAAFLYSRSSERFHRWLTEHPRFGASLRAWQEHGVISRRAKFLASTSIVIGLSVPLAWLSLPTWLRLVIAAIGLAVLSFILSRPSLPPQPLERKRY